MPEDQLVRDILPHPTLGYASADAVCDLLGCQHASSIRRGLWCTVLKLKGGHVNHHRASTPIAACSPLVGGRGRRTSRSPRWPAGRSASSVSRRGQFLRASLQHAGLSLGAPVIMALFITIMPHSPGVPSSHHLSPRARASRRAPTSSSGSRSNSASRMRSPSRGSP